MYRYLFLKLQLKKGLDIKQFRDRFTVDPLDMFSSLFSKLSEYGCLQQKNGAISLTKYGAYFVEDVCDYITDTVIKEESNYEVRAPHSAGGRPSGRLRLTKKIT
jgi:coproporphyrinogen III oxidase-like Fe-S oxidoreductase